MRPIVGSARRSACEDNPARMKFARLIVLVLPLLLGFAARPAGAAEARPSAQVARYEQLLRESVAADPAAQLVVAEAMAALGRRAEADALRGALIGLMIRRVEGEPVDPALTIGSLLAQPGAASPPTTDSALAQAWSSAVARHVQLRFLDAAAAKLQSLPADARSGLEPQAPGLWASPAPVGSLILFVTVHQGQPVPLLVTRLHAAWLDTHLTCLPANGRGARESDVVFACEGTSHAATLPALRKAVSSTASPLLAGDVAAGEFDTPTATSAWIDALASGHDAELKRLLARAAPCESAADPAQRCVLGENKASPTPSPAQRPGGVRKATAPPEESSDVLYHDVINRLASWFFGGAIVCWLICGGLRSSSLVVEVVVHVLVVNVLCFASWLGLVVFYALWVNRFGHIGLEGGFVWGSIFSALLMGISGGGALHMGKVFLEWRRA